MSTAKIVGSKGETLEDSDRIPFNGNFLSVELAEKILKILEEKQQNLPVSKRLELEKEIRETKHGKKRDISNQVFHILLKTEYKHLIDEMDIKWSEKKVLKKFIEHTMGRMYEVA
ncbi:MAG: hypothetical protein ACFFG0_29955 [Candidatus Thorarchaeota archaeon]